MVKAHSDSERGNQLPPHGLLLLYAPSLRQNSTYHGLCYTSRGALAGTRNFNKGKKEMFYLTTHSTRFDLPLYGIGHMVKDYLDNEIGNPHHESYVQ